MIPTHRPPRHARLAHLAFAALVALAPADLIARDRPGRRQPSASEPAAVPAQAPTGAPAVGEPAVDPAFAAKVNALVDRLGMDKESRRQARADIIAIGRSATPVLLPRFADPVFPIRWEMVNIQGDLRDERAVAALVERVLRDENPHVRWRAIWALNEFPEGNDETTRRLLRAALASDDWPTRWNAAVGLSMFGGEDAIPVLHQGLADPDPWRRWEAISQLGKVHDSGSVGLLAPFLSSADPRERHEAVLSLGDIATPEAVDLLIGALKDPSPGVRWRAVMALGLTQDARAIPHLRELELVEKDEDVIRHLQRVLKGRSSRTR